VARLNLNKSSVIVYNTHAVHAKAIRIASKSHRLRGIMWEVVMKFEKETIEVLPAALRTLEEGFGGLPTLDMHVPCEEHMAEVMQQVAVRLRDNYPYFHPLYAGQMLKPPHPIARAAYALATWINPNNHALDGGRASSAMEKEAVAEIASMFGWQTHVGHLSSGGTMANLEALWVAGQLHPGR